jgi:hypothetical protein
MTDDTTNVIPLRPRRSQLRIEYPERRSRNGHHPDCPYPSTDHQWCAICASIRKGADPWPE